MSEMSIRDGIMAFVLLLVLFTNSYPIIGKPVDHDVRYLSEFLDGSIMFSPTEKPILNDISLPSDYEVSGVTYLDTTEGQEGPYPSQTSLFMIGKASVSIIFLESNGAIDPETEDWDYERINEVTNDIKDALNWFSSQEPNARIQWVIHSQIVETGYEPINRGKSYHSLFVNDAMNNLGYTSGDYTSKVRSYNDDLRNADGTHWAFVIFVADSLRDLDGEFPGYSHTYAKRTGPYFLTTYDASGMREATVYENVMAHETGHIFGAADEYCLPGWHQCHCDYRYGFLNVLNMNCTAGCPEGNCRGGEPECNGCDACYTSGCLMYSNKFCLSVGTRYQIGWRDEDGDGILDAVDTTYNNWNDNDGDAYVNYLDNCPDDYNPDQEDEDGDWIGDMCDAYLSDYDNDGSDDSIDNCPSVPNSLQEDWDGDNIGDACDNCPDVDNSDQADADGSGIGDACNDAYDQDGDDHEDDYDNCPLDSNSGQEDADDDYVGNICDNCLNGFNPDQENSDEDSYGDVCDNCWYVSNDQTDTDGDCDSLKEDDSYWDGSRWLQDPQCGDACTLTITIESPKNCTDYPACTDASYHKLQIPLNFTVNAEITYAGYSLDGGPEEDVSGNITHINGHTVVYTKFDAPAAGYHTITVTADGESSDPHTFFHFLGDMIGPDGISDGKVDMRDVAFVAKLYGGLRDSGNYDERADMNDDGKIDMKDVALVCKYYGNICPKE